MAIPTEKPSKKLTHADIRMYRMGTGDCFVVKFFAGKVNTFTMMIDCGTWQGKQEHLQKYVTNLIDYLKEDKPSGQPPTVDLLVVTHEHKDHVYGFEACKDLFVTTEDTITEPATGAKKEKIFIAKRIWMGWTENDNSTATGDPLADQVKEWKEDHGQRKKALKTVANKVNAIFASDEQKQEAEQNSKSMTAFHLNFANALDQFADLHFSVNGREYVDGLKGMGVVKKEIAENNIAYLQPGQIIENMENAEGLRFYVLGPPTSIESIKAEGAPANEPNETFSHSQNNSRADNNAFATAVLNLVETQSPASLLPFNEEFVSNATAYAYDKGDWRNIEHDWLNSAGSFALRMNSATNNLSLALAIEFVDSERVLLFPGDAEYGSWASWHDIAWPIKPKDEEKHLTEELLNRTVFYKVAHHLSHNGTAKRLGVQKMIHQDLVAMATLDYGVISKGWKNTMPNRDLILDLLTRTKGRLIIMNEEGLTVDKTAVNEPLQKKIEEARKQLMSPAEQAKFKKEFTKDDDGLYLQYRVEG